MKNKSIAAVLILAIWVLGSAGTTWACKAAGPNKHIGSVTAIDAEAKTFTLRDAETEQLITFEATDKILKGLKVEDRVMVSYEEENGKLIAVDVHS